MKLTSVIIVGVVSLGLVRIALPTFRNNVTTMSAGGTMRGELRVMVGMADSLAKTGGRLDSAAMIAGGFRATGPGMFTRGEANSDNGTRFRILEAGPHGFAAEATSERLAADARCIVWTGTATPPIRGAEEGRPKCEKFFEPLLGRERLRR